MFTHIPNSITDIAQHYYTFGGKITGISRTILRIVSWKFPGYSSILQEVVHFPPQNRAVVFCFVTVTCQNALGYFFGYREKKIKNITVKTYFGVFFY